MKGVKMKTTQVCCEDGRVKHAIRFIEGWVAVVMHPEGIRQCFPSRGRRSILALLTAAAAAVLSSRAYAAPQMQFGTPTNFNLGAPCDQICAGDFNGDGMPDLAVRFNGIYLSILTNDGSGALFAFTNYNTSLYLRAIATGDFNNDHKPDIVTVMDNYVKVWLGNGDGTFMSTNVSFNSYGYGNAVTTGDFNRDGKMDLAVSVQYEFQIFLGQGDGNFTFLTNYSSGNPSYSIATGDFNGDTNTDLVTANYSYSSMSVFLGNADGTFASPTNYSGDFSEYHYSAAVGDFNGDGKPDLTTVNFYNSSISVRLNNGDGTFGAEKKYKTAFGPVAVAVADFNGDGNLDIVTANAGTSESLAILPGNGDGTFDTALTNFPGVGGFLNQSLVVADFNGDGKPDVATTRIANNSVSLLLNRTLPALRVQATNGVAKLMWPNWSGYSLECTTNLCLTNGWVTVTNAPAVVGSQKILARALDGGSQFFRLKGF
jgi:hypothetical protein